MQLPLLLVTWQRSMLSKRFSRTHLASKLMPPRYYRVIGFYLTAKAFCFIDHRRLFLIHSLAINWCICCSVIPVYDRALPWRSWGFGSYCHNKSHNNRMAASINQSIRTLHSSYFFMIRIFVSLLESTERMGFHYW